MEEARLIYEINKLWDVNRLNEVCMELPSINAVAISKI